MGREESLALGLVVFLSACSGKTPVPSPQPSPQPSSSEVAEAADSADKEVARLKRDLVETRAALSASQEGRALVEQALSEQAEELAALEEASASLELELASALEELLRSQASLRNVQSRAFAVSRIAEVRVQLEAARRHDDPALKTRVERAGEFLTRADQTLAEDNIGGAAYLADRAGELLRQARIVAEIRKQGSRELIPIVPPRSMEVQAAANLRLEPSSESPRLAGLGSGTQVEAVARHGDWYQIVTANGTKAWIHRALVR